MYLYFLIGECGCLPYQLFPFPQDEEEKKLWVLLVNRQVDLDNKSPWQPSQHSRVCSAHFVHGYPSNDKPLPTKNLGYDTGNKFSILPVYRRANRAIKEKKHDIRPAYNPETSTLLPTASTSSARKEEKAASYNPYIINLPELIEDIVSVILR